MKRIALVISGIVCGLGLVAVPSVHATTSGVNYSTVTSCENVVGGIRISRNNGPKYILTSECRDAGHGMRNYTMSCVSRTQYMVSWTETNSCANKDTVRPTASISASPSSIKTGQQVNIYASASDNIGVARIDVYQDGERIKRCDSVTMCNTTVTLRIPSTVHTKNYSFYTKVTDTSGNTRTSNTVNVRVTR